MLLISSGARVTVGCEFSCRLWELILGPLETSVYLTAKSSLQFLEHALKDGQQSKSVK